MDENEKKQNDLLTTTDSLEAIGAFRTMKNFLFVIVLICLLLLQLSFWLVNSNVVKMEDKYETADNFCSLQPNVFCSFPVPLTAPVATNDKASTEKQNPPSDPNLQEHASPVIENVTKVFCIKFTHLAILIRFCNYLLIMAATLYFLTMLFSLKISLLARLGGINHISRAFFISLIMLVVLCPWQKFFPGVIVGSIYTSSELARWHLHCAKGCSIFFEILFYLRFVGIWFVTILLLISSQVRSSQWAKAVLRRLELA